MQIEHKSLELMHEQRLTVFTDMEVCVQRDGVGVEQVRQYALLFEWSPNKETRITDCFRSYLNLVVRIFFGFYNLGIISKLRF